MSLPSLSLCMIIRDEEAMLPDFLRSVENLWDELIVVDTGSTDKSVALVEAAGARVIHFSWIDDFSAARNKSLEAATAPWIIFLDADERPSPELVSQIRSLVKDDQAGAATLVLRNQWPDGSIRDASLLRLFHNHQTIRFEHLIHEDISTGVRNYLRSENLVLRQLSGVVQHLGYLREVAGSRNKKNRDLELLKRAIKSNPDDFYCWFKIMEIARFWADPALWESTASEVSKQLSKASAPVKADLLSRSFSGELAALVAHGMKGDDQERLRWLNQSEDFATPSAAWHLRRGLLWENLKNNDKAMEAFQACIKVGTKTGPVFNPSTDQSIRAHLALCRLFLVQQTPDRAVEHLLLACTLGPADAEALLAAVSILPLVEPKNQPEQFIQEHSKKYPQTKIELTRALISIGKVDFAYDVLSPIVWGPSLDKVSPIAEQQADAVLGYLTCCLVLNKDLDLQVDVDQETADLLFQGWIKLLWKSRNTQAMEAFAQGCASVLELFPWLPEFLKKETRTTQ